MKTALRSFFILTVSTSALMVPAISQDDKITYQDHVLPIFENKCLNCHNPDESKGGLDLSSFSATMTGGSGGEIAIAQDPLGSRLYTLMAHKEEPHMPPKKPKAPETELLMIQKWIDGGMLETKSSKAKKSDKPKLDMNLLTTSGKPEGPPPMPQDLILQPEVVTERPSTIPAIAHSPWAPILAVAAQKQVLLYHSEDFDLLGVLPYPEGFPQALEFSQNGSLLMCGGGRGGKNGNVVAWDVKTGERVIEVGKEFDIVLGADISPNHRFVVMGGPGRNIKLWDTVKGEQVNSIKKHPDWMLTANFSPDGVLFATGGRNAGLYVWEAETGYEFYTLKGHTKAITDMSWRPDSNVLATSSEDGQVILWDMNSGNQIKKWSAHGGGALAVAYAPDGNIATAGRDKTVKLWKGDGTAIRTIAASDDIVMTVSFSHDSKRVISGDFHGKVAVWNVADGVKLSDINANPPTIDQQLAYSQKRITELTTNLPKLKAAITAAGAELATVKTKHAAAAKAAAEAAAKKAATDKQVATLDGQVKAFTTQHQQAQQVLAQKQADAKAKTDAMTAVAQAKTAAQNDATKWTAEMKKYEPVIAKVAGEIAAAKAAAEKPLLDPATQKALTDALAAAAPQIQAKQKADADVTAKTTAQQGANTALAAAQKAVTDAQNAFNGAQQAQQAAQGKVTAADAAAKAAAAKLAAANPAPPELTQAKQQADQALATAQQTLTTAVNATKAAEAQLNARKSMVPAAQNALNAANQQLAQAKTVQANAIKALAPHEAKIKPLRDKENAAKAAQAKAKELLAAKTTEHQNALKALTNAKNQFAAATKRMTDEDAKLKGAQAAKTAADAEVQKANAALAAKAKELTESRTKLAAAQKEATTATQQADATKKAQEAQQAAVAAVTKKEADAKKALEVAKADLGSSQFLVKKWQAAAVNLQVRDEGVELEDMEVELDEMEEEVVGKQEEHKKAAAELAAAEKTLADAKQTVATGTKTLAEKTTSVLETILQLASAKAAAEVREGAIGEESSQTETEAEAVTETNSKPAENPIEVAAIETISERPREEIEQELLSLRDRLNKLEGLVTKSYQEAGQTKQTIVAASAVAAKTPAVIAERSQVEDAKEAEARKALEEKQRQEAAVAAQKKRIEELRAKYSTLLPQREG